MDVKPEIYKRAKALKMMLWMFVGTTTMFFAGFLSAYIVQKGDRFWVSLKIPNQFWVSTIIIALSSISLGYALINFRKQKLGIARIGLILTIALGIGFGVSQFYGWKDFYQRGNALKGKIFNIVGVYGNHFSLGKNGIEILTDDNNYYLEGIKINESGIDEMKNFMKNFTEDVENGIKKGSSEFQWFFNNTLLTIEDNQLYYEGEPLSIADREELKMVAKNFVIDRGEIFIDGEYGKDFQIDYKGKPLEYKQGKFYRAGGLELTESELSKLKEVDNISSSYLYVITALHLVHIVLGMIFLILTLFITNQYSDYNHLIFRLAARFWHYLGILWVILLLFLIFYSLKLY